MKRMILGVVLVGMGLAGRAQTFDEWFEQNSTRKKYNEEQIAAWQVYIGVLEKGYSIVESGLGTIRGIKTGEFNLHSAFYTSLETVSPVVANMGEVAEIAALQAAIVKRFTAALARYRETGGLTGGEVAYISEVYAEILKEGLADVSALSDILTSGTLQLSDDQRMDRVQVLDDHMRARYLATLAITDQADELSMVRTAQGVDVETLKAIYGLP
jgi:hypothetical protein